MDNEIIKIRCLYAPLEMRTYFTIGKVYKIKKVEQNCYEIEDDVKTVEASWYIRNNSVTELEDLTGCKFAKV